MPLRASLNRRTILNQVTVFQKFHMLLSSAQDFAEKRMSSQVTAPSSQAFWYLGPGPGHLSSLRMLMNGHLFSCNIPFASPPLPFPPLFYVPNFSQHQEQERKKKERKEKRGKNAASLELVAREDKTFQLNFSPSHIWKSDLDTYPGAWILEHIGAGGGPYPPKSPLAHTTAGPTSLLIVLTLFCRLAICKSVLTV